MATTIEQQVALDEDLVPSRQRLRIGRSNFRLTSDIQSKEPTLQVVYDVLRRSPFFKAFLVMADVPEIYMQEFWAIAKEILEFLRFLGHSAQIKTLTDVNVNELYQTWRSFAAVINKCLTGKSSGIDSLRNTKAYKEYYACATGEAAPKPKASARKKKGVSASSTTPPTPIAIPTPTATVVAAPRLSAIAKGKQPARATSPTDPSDVERTEAEQLKIVLRRSRQETHISQQCGSSTDEGTDVDDQTKGCDENEGEKTDESDDDDDDQDEAEKVNDNDDDEEEISKICEQKAIESDEGDDEATESDRESEDEKTREQEEESFDTIPRTPEDSEDDGNNEEDQGLRISEEERVHKEEEADELYRDVDINQGRGLQVSQETEDSHVILTPTHSDGQQESLSTSSFVTNLLNLTIDPGMESIFTIGSSTVTPIPSPQSTMTPSIISTSTTASQLPIPPTPIPSLDLQNLPTFASVFRFEDRVKSLEVNFSNILGIVHQYMHQQMPEAVQEAVQTQTDRLQDSIQRENDEFLKTIDDNMKKIIKEQIIPLSRTSYAVAADLSEMELKKILIEKMEGNKSSYRSDEQRNLYKALFEAYDADKTILDTYGESAILKRKRKDDDQEGPSAGSDQGSKRRREGGEHASASTPSEPAIGKEPVQTTCQMEEPSHPVFETGAEDQPIIQTSQHPEWFSQPRKPPTPDRDWNKSLPAAQGDAQSWISALAKQTDARSLFNELLDTPIDFSNVIMNRLGIDTLTPELLAGLTYELMRGSCNSLIELEYHLEEVYKAMTDQLDWVNPEGASSQKYITSVTKTKVADYGHIKWIEELVPRVMWIQEPINYDKHVLWGVSHWGQKRQQFYGFAVNRESTLDVYPKRRIIAVTDLKIVEWYNYKHLDWISVRRDDDKIYKFKEGDFKRLRLQDIEDMLLLLVQGKLSNLTVEERFAFNISLKMFTRSIVIQRRVEDLQLRVESYQKRLNFTKPDTYRSDLKQREADGTLNDVRNALDDHLKGIQMQYLPTTIWRKGDKDRAAAMIQAIDKMLKTRWIMRSLERFVGGRQYEGDFRLLQRTI
nr:hypothetical protein [Tanacetum cinerariifolium]